MKPAIISSGDERNGRGQKAGRSRRGDEGGRETAGVVQRGVFGYNIMLEEKPCGIRRKETAKKPERSLCRMGNG